MQNIFFTKLFFSKKQYFQGKPHKKPLLVAMTIFETSEASDDKSEYSETSQ